MKLPADIDQSEQEKIRIIDRISSSMERTFPPANKHLKMAVIIPAKNEAESIIPTLEAIAGQRTPTEDSLDFEEFELIILCHNCTDHTAEVCHQFSLKNPSFPIHILELNHPKADTVGSARRILMNIASKRLRNPQALIISTDADTIPDSKWLFYMSTYLNSKVGYICGYIQSNLQEIEGQALAYLKAKDEYLALRTRLESVLLPDQNNPWPRHAYNWGPNIAIKKHVYQAVGGIRPLHFLEDVDLFKRVRRQGYIIKHCLKSRVTTSTRINARCLEGFGAELKIWSEINEVTYNVEGLNKLLLRFKIYTSIENYFNSYSKPILLEISSMSGMNLLDLIELVRKNPKKEHLIFAMENYLNSDENWNIINPNIDVLMACEEIKTYLNIFFKN